MEPNDILGMHILPWESLPPSPDTLNCATSGQFVREKSCGRTLALTPMPPADLRRARHM